MLILLVASIQLFPVADTALVSQFCFLGYTVSTCDLPDR